MRTQINIKATGIDLTEKIKDYVEKKIGDFEKFFKYSNEDVVFAVEIGKTTNHHKQGEVYKAEINFSFSGASYYAMSEEVDLYLAIDEAKKDAERQLTEKKDRNDTLFRRGARSVKKMMKGLSKRNPFTSKY